MNREQVNEFKEFVLRMARKSDLMVQDFEYSEFCKELDSVCAQALNSIPKAFDAEDETTWPPAIDCDYVCWCSDDENPEILAWFEGSNSRNWRSNKVTKYMPIPEVET